VWSVSWRRFMVGLVCWLFEDSDPTHSECSYNIRRNPHFNHDSLYCYVHGPVTVHSRYVHDPVTVHSRYVHDANCPKHVEFHDKINL
jgi:hypothetical protein